MTPKLTRAFTLSEAILFLLILGSIVTLCVIALARPAKANDEAPYWSYEWPCSGYEYGNAPLIYEAQFPGAHPGITTLSGLTFDTSLLSPKKRKTASVGVTVVLVNRRENREPGYAQLLFHKVYHQGTVADVSNPVTFPPITLVEGDMVKVGIACAPIGKVPKLRPSIRFTLDFEGEE